MKILTINHEYPPLGGGGGIFTRDLAEELAKNHHIDVLTTHMKGLSKEEKINGVNVIRVPVLDRTSKFTASLPALLTFVPSCILKGSSLIKKNSYDLIHTHFAVPAGPAGIFLSKAFKIPHVLSIHGGDIYDPSKKTSPHRHFLLRSAIHKIMNNSSKVVAQSENTKSNALRIYKPSKEIDVIPLGIPSPEFLPAKKEELGLDRNTLYIISIGRLVKRKGYDHLIRAFSRLKKSLPDSGLIIMGNGPELGNLEDLAKELHVRNDVLFLDSADDTKKFQYLAVSDIYALSSLHEGFGIVLLEAMSQGLPIVATNNGGQTDIVKEGVNGILVDPCDSKELARALYTVAADTALRERLGSNNKKTVEYFSITAIAEKYAGYFKSVI